VNGPSFGGFSPTRLRVFRIAAGAEIDDTPIVHKDSFPRLRGKVPKAEGGALDLQLRPDLDGRYPARFRFGARRQAFGDRCDEDDFGFGVGAGSGSRPSRITRRSTDVLTPLPSRSSVAGERRASAALST